METLLEDADQHSTPTATIITDGCQYLQLSPSSLLTPRSNNITEKPAAQAESSPLQGSGPGRCREAGTMSPLSVAAHGCSRGRLASGIDGQLVAPVENMSMRRLRRLAVSPSDDECSPVPTGHGLRTPACLPVVLQFTSPSEPTSSCGVSGSSSAGRLVCNLIERFNNTQLYDGINDSP